MGTEIAKKLAESVTQGEYKPTRLDSCDALAPIDRNPHTVRFSQFLFLSTPESRLGTPGAAVGVRFATLGNRHLAALTAGQKKHIERQIDKLSARTISRLGIVAELIAGDLPEPRDERENSLDAMREALRLRRPDIYDDKAEAAEVRSKYGAWIRQEVVSACMKLARAGLSFKGATFWEMVTHAMEEPRKFAEEVQKKIAEMIESIVHTPSEATLEEKQPIFALCTVYEQIWTPKGYTRGDLVNSFSLAPGEQLTLEFHSWDKTTSKREAELTDESERRVSSTLTVRDNQQVVKELATQMGGKLNANAGLDIPIPVGEVPLPVEAGLEGETTAELDTKLTETMEQATEKTLEASQVLKNSRRLRIEVARDVGREEKQTRTIANTNRCHALNAYYFEMMVNYMVQTRFTGVIPCVLLPADLIPTHATDPAKMAQWVLCHEHVLKDALLDDVFVAGFEAAKLLESARRFDELVKSAAPPSAPAEAAGPPSTAPGGDPLEEEFRRHKKAIVDAYKNLKRDAEKAQDILVSCADWLGVPGVGVAGYVANVLLELDGDLMPLRRLLYWATLQTSPHAINSLDTLEKSSGPAREAVRNFFAAVDPRDFKYNVVATTVADGLEALGVPEDVVDAVVDGGLISYLDDDAGLYVAVKAAYDRLQQVEINPAFDVAQGMGQLGGQPTQAGGAGAPEEIFSLRDRAEAEVEFQRLVCHLRDNREHYQQALWQRMHPDVRYRKLRAWGQISRILSNQPVGFHGRRIAFPVTELAAAGAPFVRVKNVLTKIKERHASDEPTEYLVTLPTMGTALEVVLGRCDACEPYIQESRLIDLRKRTACARQEEAEAQRREQRLAKQELDAFQAEPPAFHVRIDGAGGRSGDSGDDHQ